MSPDVAAQSQLETCSVIPLCVQITFSAPPIPKAGQCEPHAFAHTPSLAPHTPFEFG